MSMLIAVNIAVTILFLLIVAIALFVYGTIFLSLYSDAPFVPVPMRVGRAMVELAEVKADENVVDLGSGHGTILFAAVERGTNATGYELSRSLIALTKVRQFLFHRKANIKLHCQDFFKADIHEADVVFCYLFSKTMDSLRLKFESQLKPGTRIVTATFKIHDWLPIKNIQVGNHKIYLYKVPEV